MVTKLIIGLGNPGIKYGKNRHNVGYMVIDVLKDLPEGVIAKKTSVFMNNSGEAVAKLVNWYKIEPEDLFIIHDDLDIRLGEYKVQKGKGPRLHYGVQSIEKALGTGDFWRVRVGIDNRVAPEGTDVPESKARSWHTPGEQYVLQDFTEEEKKILEDVIKKVVEELKKEN